MLDKKKLPTFFYRLVIVFTSLYTASSVAEVLTPLFTTPTRAGDHTVVVGFYKTDRCVDGKELAIRTMNISANCFVWRRRLAEGGTRDNAAGGFRCHKNRLYYRQYPNNSHCDGNFFSDKSFSTYCQQERNGNWSKIISGTAHCPQANP